MSLRIRNAKIAELEYLTREAREHAERLAAELQRAVIEQAEFVAQACCTRGLKLGENCDVCPNDFRGVESVTGTDDREYFRNVEAECSHDFAGVDHRLHCTVSK